MSETDFGLKKQLVTALVKIFVDAADNSRRAKDPLDIYTAIEAASDQLKTEGKIYPTTIETVWTQDCRAALSEALLLGKYLQHIANYPTLTLFGDADIEKEITESGSNAMITILGRLTHALEALIA